MITPDFTIGDIVAVSIIDLPPEQTPPPRLAVCNGHNGTEWAYVYGDGFGMEISDTSTVWAVRKATPEEETQISEFLRTEAATMKDIDT